MYRARRSDPQISKNNTFFKIDCPAYDIVDRRPTLTFLIGDTPIIIIIVLLNLLEYKYYTPNLGRGLI